MKQFPGVPTLDSELPGFDEPSTWILSLPVNTPAEVVEWYTREFTRAFRSDTVKTMYNDNLLVERPDLSNSLLIKKWVQLQEKQWQNPIITKNKKTPQGRTRTYLISGWLYKQHLLLDHLADGKDIDSFFEDLPTPSS